MTDHMRQLDDRQMLFGEVPRRDTASIPYDLAEDPRPTGEDLLLARMDARGLLEDVGVVVIPVIARPFVEKQRGEGWVDHTAHVVWGDVTEEMSLDPFERTQAEYNGTAIRGIPTFGFDATYSNPE